MGKQINQYTKTRQALEVTNFDYLDLDASDDSGATYESAKIEAKDFAAYVGNFLNITTIYSGDGTISGDRTIENSTLVYPSTINLKGVRLEISAELLDDGFAVNTYWGAVRAEMYNSQAANCGIFNLYDTLGKYFEATSSKVGIGGAALNHKLNVKGGDIEIQDQGDGLIVKDISTGSRYRILVDNATIQLEAVL